MEAAMEHWGREVQRRRVGVRGGLSMQGLGRDIPGFSRSLDGERVSKPEPNAWFRDCVRQVVALGRPPHQFVIRERPKNGPNF